MKNNSTAEAFVSIIIVVLTLALADVFKFWMPDAVHMMVLAMLIASFALFTVFIWHEKPRDEREAHNRGRAGRVGFLSGSAVLTVGIVIQSYYHILDIWLVVALVAMVLSKLAAVAYGRWRW